VEQRLLIAAIPKGRQGGRAVRPLLGGTPEVQLALRERFATCPAGAAAAFSTAVPRHIKFVFVLELWAGTGRFSSAVAKLGYHVVLIDIRFHDSHDLTRQKLQHAILGWVRARHVLFIWMGILCKSWSRARSMPGGPAMLRSSDAVMGLSDIRLESDRTKVAEGNAMMYFAARVARACISAKIGFAIENPWSSWIFKTTAFLALINQLKCHLIRTDFCMWGTMWQKGTGFLTNAGDVGRIEKRCTGCRRGLCRRTGRPHLELRGTLPDGRFLTAVAEPYPRSLCTQLAAMAHNDIVGRRGEQMTRICNS
jgi:hypothetical protein